MTEQEYEDAIARLLPDKGDLPIGVITLIDAAVREHPRSVLLWQKRGHLIQVGPEDGPHDLAEAIASYHRALDLDPGNADIVEDIACFHDAVMGDEREAQRWFSKAEKMRQHTK
jgi:Tfp pilus assembly protein PilF